MSHGKDAVSILSSDASADDHAGGVRTRQTWEQPRMQRLGAEEAEIGVLGGGDADFLS